MALAEVSTLYESNANDIPAMLRKLAAEIEVGERGEIVEAVCIIQGPQVDVFGWGPGACGKTSLGLLSAGQWVLFQAWLEQLK